MLPWHGNGLDWNERNGFGFNLGCLLVDGNMMRCPMAWFELDLHRKRVRLVPFGLRNFDLRFDLGGWGRVSY